MADVFISYAREDQEQVKRLVEALEKLGLSVFWDRTIPVGQTWRMCIGNALNAASCVLVVWSRHSITSEWVPQEADEAKSRHVYIPVLLDSVIPPLGLRNTQAADLVSWNGDLSDPQFIQLKNAVTALVEQHKAGQRVRKTLSESEQQPNVKQGGKTRRQYDASDQGKGWWQNAGARKNILIVVAAIVSVLIFVVLISPYFSGPTMESKPQIIPSIPSQQSTPSPAEVVPSVPTEGEFPVSAEIYCTYNTDRVTNEPVSPAVFTLSTPVVITMIETYHWNDGQGTYGGRIGLRNANGKIYGPWSVVTSAGQGGAPNVYWKAQPHIRIPAGTYTVIDSHPETWSQNAKSEGRGFVLVQGYQTR
jgi:hypothetical protein